MNGASPSRLLLGGIALALILLWSSAFTFVSVGVKSLSPLWLVAGRLTIASILLVMIALFSKHRFPPILDRRWAFYGILGVTGAVLPFFLIASGQLQVDSGLSAIIIAIMPLMTIVLAHFFADERLTLFKTLGFMMGFAGIVVLFLPDTGGLGLAQDWGSQLLIVLAAFFYALTAVAAKRAPKTPSTIGAAMMMSAAAIITIAFALITDPTGFTPTGWGWISVIVLGLGSTGVATILYLYFIEVSGPSNLARINYLVPPASVVFGIWFLDEPLTWKIPVAFVIIFAGVFISRIGQNKPVTAHDATAPHSQT